MKASLDTRARGKVLNLQRLEKRKKELIAEGHPVDAINTAITKIKHSIKTHNPAIGKRLTKRGRRGKE